MKDIFWTLAVYLTVLVVCSCSSLPSIDRYNDHLEEYLGKSEDSILTDFGVPDKVIELSQGTRTLVYTELPYRSSPLTKNENLWCKTIFRVDKQARVQYYAAEGTFCVR